MRDIEVDIQRATQIVKMLRHLASVADELRIALDKSPVIHGFADEREALHVAILDAREALGKPAPEPAKPRAKARA